MRCSRRDGQDTRALSRDALLRPRVRHAMHHLTRCRSNVAPARIAVACVVLGVLVASQDDYYAHLTAVSAGCLGSLRRRFGR